MSELVDPEQNICFHYLNTYKIDVVSILRSAITLALPRLAVASSQSTRHMSVKRHTGANKNKCLLGRETLRRITAYFTTYKK